MRRKKSRDSYIKFKNTADRVIAGAGLVILSPVMAGIAIAIKAEEGISAPVFFKQKRVGINKSHFMLYKFRSMRADTPHDMPTHLLLDPEQYLTKTGKWLRKTSLDELPQLFNTLKGDMSLVGPRPEIPYFVEQFRETVPLYMVKYQVRPGMTGWAQVNGYRGDTSIPARVEHDLWYIENWSVGLDIKILFMTAFGGMVNSEKVSIAPKSHK